MGCLNLSLDAKHDMWAYLILYSVKWKYWNDFVSKVFGFVFRKMKILECLCRENEILVYLVSYSVKCKYWNVPCCENEILAYMVTILINMKVELVPWFKTWYLDLFGFNFGKLNTCVFSTIILFLDDSCRKNDILAFMVANMINEKVELVTRCPLMRNMTLVRVCLDFGKPKVWEFHSMILKPKMIWT